MIEAEQYFSAESLPPVHALEVEQLAGDGE
jgi:hypothetical protein